MNIPIRNIYYLLCYAWNRMQETEEIKTDSSDYEQLPDLLAKVLLNGCTRLLKQGLEKSYTETTELYQGIKGKLEFNASIRSFAFSHGKSICTYDEFTPDILQNQLIKATLVKIIKLPGLDKKLGHSIRNLIYHFNSISDIQPTSYDFTKVKIHRNNRSYDFILKLCQLILNNISLDERTGKFKFKDLVRDQITMQALFEDFVRNFYRQKLGASQVKRDRIKWKAVPIKQTRPGYLPEMQTDTSITLNGERIIIDTKYYGEALSMNRFDQQKFHSGNLYQIYAYLNNLKPDQDDKEYNTARGILLYPTTSVELDEHFQVEKHKISVCTVNLASEWRKIESRLLNLLDTPTC